MKRSFAILLASLMLVASLTACGRNKNQENTNDTPETNTEENHTDNQSDGMLGGSGSNGQETTPNANGNTANGTDDTQQPNSEDNGVLNEPGNTAPSSDGGVSYEKMLRNGRTRDSDGLLSDGENAVSDIITGSENAVNDIVRGGQNAANDILR